MGGAAHVGQTFFQLGDLGPHDEAAVVENLGDGSVHRVAEARALSLKVDEGDGRGAHEVISFNVPVSVTLYLRPSRGQTRSSPKRSPA